MIDEVSALNALTRLDRELAAKGAQCELCSVAGLIVPLVFAAEPESRAVGHLFAPTDALDEAAAAVAREVGLPERWLSEAARAILARPGAPWLELGHLRVLDPPPAYVLAMKCAAADPGRHAADQADLRLLMRVVDAQTAEEVVAAVGPYFGEHQLPTGLRTLLSEPAGD